MARFRHEVTAVDSAADPGAGSPAVSGRSGTGSARSPKGKLLIIGLMLLGLAWFFVGWGLQDLRATQHASRGDIRPGTLSELAWGCRGGCVVGRFVSDDGTVVRGYVTYPGVLPGNGITTLRAADIGDFDQVYPPGVVPDPLNWGGPLAGGVFVLLSGLTSCLLAWALRAREPWFARRVPRTPPPEALEILLYAPRRRAAGGVAASGVLLLALTVSLVGLIGWGLRTEQVLGLALIAALCWVCALGATSREVRALMRRPRLWLAPGELILREPVTLAADLRIPRRSVESVRVETRPRERYRSRRYTAEPSPYSLSVNLELRLRRSVGPLPLQSGWNGVWSRRVLPSGGMRLALHPYRPRPGRTYEVLLLRAHDPEQAATTIGAWATDQSFSTGA